MAEAAAPRPSLDERGEITLMLAGVEMGLRPSYEAIAAFERATGKGLFALATQAADGALTLEEVAAIACECIRAWGRDVDDENAAGAKPAKVAKLILDSDGGFMRVILEIAALLNMAATGGYTSSGELKPAAKKSLKEVTTAAG